MYRSVYPKPTIHVGRVRTIPAREMPPTIGRLAAPYAVSLVVAAIADLSWAVTR